VNALAVPPAVPLVNSNQSPAAITLALDAVTNVTLPDDVVPSMHVALVAVLAQAGLPDAAVANTALSKLVVVPP